MDKKNSLKGKSIYHIVTTLTLFVPLPLYLFLMATLFSINADYIVYTSIENVEVIELTEDKEVVYFLTTLDNAKMDGVVEFKESKYGIVISEDNIIKINKDYYSYVLKDDVRQLVDIKKFEMQKQQSYKIPLSVFISLFSVLIVIAIIQGKMQWHKRHPRVATFVALLTGTVILFILNAVIGNVLNVFLVGTASWAIYCLEYLVYQGMLDEKDREKKESDVLRQLRELMK